MHLKCCYSSCKSDSRKSEPGIKFMPFPKPNNYGNNWEQQNWQLSDCISAAVLCFQGRAILSRHITWRTSEPKQKQMRNSLRPVFQQIHPELSAGRIQPQLWSHERLRSHDSEDWMEDFGGVLGHTLWGAIRELGKNYRRLRKIQLGTVV